MARGRVIIGTGIILTCAAGLLLSNGEEPFHYEEGSCYSLVFTGKQETARKQETGAEWKPFDCDYLENLLEQYPETAYIDAEGRVHSSLGSSTEGEPGEDDDTCLNPYDEDLGVDEKIDRVACWYDVRPDFLHGLWEVESKKDHWDSGQEDGVKRSYAGAVGIAQVMPGHTGESVVDGHSLKLEKEVDNMELGAQALEGKCSTAVSIANANGFETRQPSEEEPCGAIRYMCAGTWGNAYSIQDEGDITWGELLHDEWYTAPEDVMARAYNGVSCGGNLISYFYDYFIGQEHPEAEARGLAADRGARASYGTVHYVELVQEEGGITDHSFDD